MRFGGKAVLAGAIALVAGVFAAAPGASTPSVSAKGSTIYFNGGSYDALEGDGSMFSPFSIEPSGKGEREIKGDAEDLTACTNQGKTRLAYVNFSTKKPRKYNVWAMDADGKHKQRLTLGNDDAEEPAFSPSCKRIVFSRDGDIWAVGVRGGKEKQLLDREDVHLGDKKAYFEHPSYSPDGKRLIMSATCAGFSFCRNDKYLTGLYTMPASGGDPKEVTAEPSFDAKYSPDGKQIVFERDDEIFLAGADGSAPQQITDDDLPERDPAFSPDGSKIVYVHFTRFDQFGEDGSSREPNGPAIVIGDLTGQTSRQITKPGLHPSWVAD